MSWRLLLAFSVVVVVLGAAKKGERAPGGCTGLDGEACLLPWPSSAFLVADPTARTGFRVSIPATSMPAERQRRAHRSVGVERVGRIQPDDHAHRRIHVGDRSRALRPGELAQSGSLAGGRFSDGGHRCRQRRADQPGALRRDRRLTPGGRRPHDALRAPGRTAQSRESPLPPLAFARCAPRTGPPSRPAPSSLRCAMAAIVQDSTPAGTPMTSSFRSPRPASTASSLLLMPGTSEPLRARPPGATWSRCATTRWRWPALPVSAAKSEASSRIPPIPQDPASDRRGDYRPQLPRRHPDRARPGEPSADRRDDPGAVRRHHPGVAPAPRRPIWIYGHGLFSDRTEFLRDARATRPRRARPSSPGPTSPGSTARASRPPSARSSTRRRSPTSSIPCARATSTRCSCRAPSPARAPRCPNSRSAARRSSTAPRPLISATAWAAPSEPRWPRCLPTCLVSGSVWPGWISRCRCRATTPGRESKPSSRASGRAGSIATSSS